jgi:hypothetical protein
MPKAPSAGPEATWKLTGKFTRQDGAKARDTTVVALDFTISDSTMKQILALVRGDAVKTGKTGRVKAKSKSVDLRSVFR